MDWTILLTVLVGLVIFIHGIENFSREVLSFAGERFRKIIRKATQNRILGSIVGMGVTGVIQSSTAATVITVSLVSAGVISFTQSLGVIFGANVGTTITAQLVAFNMTAYAPYFIIFGFLLSLLGHSYRYIGRGIFYFGLVFYGLSLVTEAVTPIRDNPQIIEIFSNLSNPFFAIFIGFLFSAIAHSSSVTTGLVVVLAGTGVLSLEQGIPILLGSNIGTTVTALIASTQLSLHAKRAAVGHAFFNITGVLLILPLVSPFIHFIESIGGSTAQQMANAHTIFNVGLAILFLAILTPVQRLVTWLVKGDEKEVLIGTQYLNGELPKSNRRSFSLIEKELSYLLHTVFDSYKIAIQSVTNPEKANLNAVQKYEVLADLLDEKIENALLELSHRQLSENEAKKMTLLVRISNLTEQLADTSKNLGELPRSMRISSLSLSHSALEGVEKIYMRMEEPFYILKKEFPKRIPEYSKVSRRLSSVRSAITRGYNEHIKRMQTREAHGGSLFVESSSLLEDGMERLKEILKLCQHYARLR